MPRFPSLDERLATIRAAAARRAARDADRRRRRLRAADAAAQRSRRWLRTAFARRSRARRRWLALDAAVPSALRAAYLAASPEVRRLVREQVRDDRSRFASSTLPLPASVTGARRFA